MSSFAWFQATGRGRVGVRLAIEGLGYEFVSSPALEGSAGEGISRVSGLSLDGIGWEEKADILGGTLEVGGFTCRIVDRASDVAITKALSWQPSAKTWLDADLTTAGTTVTVLSTSGISATDVVHIGTECLYVSAVPTSTTLTVTRGYRNTIAQAHYTADGEKLTRPLVAVGRPTSIEGRRCYLYGYGSADDPTDDGELVFRGVCATDAALAPNGADWSITVDSITRLLEAPIGGDLEDDVGSRGIYYSWSAPWTVIIGEGISATENVFVSIPSQDYQTSFFEDQETFAKYATDAIRAEAGNFATWDAEDVEVVADGESDWHIEALLGSTASTLLIFAYSSIDGQVSQWNLPGGIPTAGRVANTRYEIRSTGLSGGEGVPDSILRRVPRGMFGTGSVSVAPSYVLADASPGRIYVAGSADLSGITAVRIDAPNGNSSYRRVYDSSSTEGWIDLGHSFDGENLGSFGYGYGDNVRIRFIRDLGTGDISTVRDTIVTDSPDLANLGGLPFLTTEDLASWTTVAAEAARGRQWAARRRYIADEEITAAEYLAEEFKAVGVFPVIDEDGKIAIARMESPAATDPSAYAVPETDVGTDQGFPTWERNAWGRTNQIAYSWGYSPAEEEHAGTIVIRDVQAFSESKAGNTIEVKPKSEPLNGEPSYGDLVGLAWPYLGIFGRAYSVVRFNGKPSLYWGVGPLGSPVSLTLSTVPNTATGERGISGTAGILVERGIDLGGGRATIGVLVLGGPIAGYAPTLQIDSFVDNGGGLYTLTVSDANPLEATLAMSVDDVSDHWHVGDGCALSESATTTAPITGTVEAVTASTIQVSLGAAPTSKDLIHYDDATAATDDQEAYVYQATDEGRITFSTVSQAKEYAP